MNPDEVTEQILGAWDEIVAEEEGTEPEASVPVTEPEEEQAEGEQEADTDGEEQAEGDEDGDEAETETDEDETEEEEESEVEAAAPQFDDVEAQAFLAKYQGNVEEALKAAADLQRVLGRQGSEKAQLSQRVEELEAQLAQVQAFGGVGGFLSEEQRDWIEAAVESPNPGRFVQEAVQAGEFELARALCRDWAQNNPFEAMRAGQFVDVAETRLYEQQSQPEQIPAQETWQALSRNYPELRQYEQQMVQTLQRLGPEHPLVQEARSTDPQVTVRGIFGIYEIAKASTFTLTEAKNGLKQKRRQEADDAIDNAVVTSATASPSASETPRQKRPLMPGLTQEDFDSAFEAEFARQ